MVIEMMFHVAVIMGALWTGKSNPVKAAIARWCRNAAYVALAPHTS